MAERAPGGWPVILLSLICAAAPGAALGLAGCGQRAHTLETGYQYQPLNSTYVQRRAFYADPYSLEARKAEAERQRTRDAGTFRGVQP